MTAESYRTPGNLDPTARVGLVVREFRSLPWWTSRQTKFAALGALGIGGWITVSMAAKYGAIGLLAPLLLLFGVAVVLHSRARGAKDMAILVHEDGIVVETPPSRAVVHFEDVREVSAYAEREDGNSVLTHLTLRDPAGVHVLPVGLLNAESIVGIIQERTLGPEYEHSVVQLTAGAPLQFGDVILDRFGINTAHWSIRWDKLTHLVIDHGAVQLFRDNLTKPSACIFWEHIPNPLLFSRLVLEFRRRGAERPR